MKNSKNFEMFLIIIIMYLLAAVVFAAKYYFYSYLGHGGVSFPELF